MKVTSIANCERFFRAAAGLDIDKEDVRRFGDFVERKLHDLILRAQAVAKANERDVIEPFDLPITKGLQEAIHSCRALLQQNQLDALFMSVPLPQVDFEYSEATVAELPHVAGGVSVALARSFKLVSPELKNPQTSHWEMVFQLFNLLL